MAKMSHAFKIPKRSIEGVDLNKKKEMGNIFCTSKAKTSTTAEMKM